MRRDNAQIESLEERINAEKRRQDENNSGRREEMQRTLDDVGKRYSDAADAVKQMEKEVQEMKDNIKKAEADKQEVIQAGERAKNEMDSIEGQLRLIAEREKSKLAPFGNQMEQVIAEIDRRQWHGEKPVGPLGRYIRLRDPMWADLMRVQLGRIMSAFAITDARDRRQLYEILNANRK